MGFSNNKSDILIHLTQWQYWWWFWFTFLWVLYYLLVARVFRYRTLKFNPRIASTLRPHGKWGDLLTCLIPITWCINILINSNFILKLIEWQSESSLFTLRVRAKQWYWIYKLDLRNISDVYSAPRSIGRNKWQSSTFGDLQTAEDYLHIIQMRAYNIWSKEYWTEVGKKFKKRNKWHVSSPVECYKFEFLENSKFTNIVSLSAKNNFYQISKKNNFTFFDNKFTKESENKFLFSTGNTLYKHFLLKSEDVALIKITNDFRRVAKPVNSFSDATELTNSKRDSMKKIPPVKKSKNLEILDFFSSPRRIDLRKTPWMRKHKGKSSELDFLNSTCNTVPKNPSKVIGSFDDLRRIFEERTYATGGNNNSGDPDKGSNFKLADFKKAFWAGTLPNRRSKFNLSRSNFFSEIVRNPIPKRFLEVKSLLDPLLIRNIEFIGHIESLFLKHNQIKRVMALISNSGAYIPDKNSKLPSFLVNSYQNEFLCKEPIFGYKNPNEPFQSHTSTKSYESLKYFDQINSKAKSTRALGVLDNLITTEISSQDRFIRGVKIVFMRKAKRTTANTFTDRHNLYLSIFNCGAARPEHIPTAFSLRYGKYLHELFKTIDNLSDNLSMGCAIREVQRYLAGVEVKLPGLKEISVVDMFKYFKITTIKDIPTGLFWGYDEDLEVVRRPLKEQKVIWAHLIVLENNDLLKLHDIPKAQPLNLLEKHKTNFFSPNYSNYIRYAQPFNGLARPNRRLNFDPAFSDLSVIKSYAFGRKLTPYFFKSVGVDLETLQNVQYSEELNKGLTSKLSSSQDFKINFLNKSSFSFKSQLDVFQTVLLKRPIFKDFNNFFKKKITEEYLARNLVSWFADAIEELKISRSVKDPKNKTFPESLMPRNREVNDISVEYGRTYADRYDITTKGTDLDSRIRDIMGLGYFHRPHLFNYATEDGISTFLKNSFLERHLTPQRVVRHPDYDEETRLIRMNFGKVVPLRIIKQPYSDLFFAKSPTKNLELFRLRFNSPTSTIANKPIRPTVYLTFKQKRYTLKNNIAQRELISPSGKYSTNPFLKNKNIIEENLNNATKQYRLVKKAKSRAEKFNVKNWNRLLRSRRVLVLPAHVNITVITNSFDIVHSWHIPGLGLKMDCLPGRATHHTLHIDNVGFYYGQCAEVCGRYHHHMPIRICALPFEHFLVWWHTFGLPKLLFITKEEKANFNLVHYMDRKFSW